MGIVDYVFAIDTLIALLKVIKSVSYSPLSLNTATEINRLILRLFAYTPYFMDKLWVPLRCSGTSRLKYTVAVVTGLGRELVKSPCSFYGP